MKTFAVAVVVSLSAVGLTSLGGMSLAEVGDQEMQQVVGGRVDEPVAACARADLVLGCRGTEFPHKGPAGEFCPITLRIKANSNGRITFKSQTLVHCMTPCNNVCTGRKSMNPKGCIVSSFD